MLGHEGFELPGIEETTEVNLALGRRANPEFRRGGISLNTSPFPEAIARRIMERIGDQTGLPVADPMRGGFDALAGAGFR